MDPSFWHERWEKGETAFHGRTVNPLLEQYWEALGVPAADAVLVPLAGKSLDMLWLRDRGHPVLGVELSPIAGEAFFREAGLEPRLSREGPFACREAGGIRLLEGNVFDLRSEHLASIHAVYDRAALIALPPETRVAYATALTERLPARVRMLLVTLELEPPVGGPPFSVDEAEVRRLFEPAFLVERLHRGPGDEPSDRMRERGVTAVRDAVYALRRGVP